MAISRFAGAATLFAVLSTEGVAEEGHFPVWLAPSVEATTPAEAAAMLIRRFTSSRELRSGPGLAMPGNSDVREVWTCEALETARREGYRGAWRSSLEQVDARCRILRLAARGKPAKISYMRDFDLDRNAPTFLPAAFGSPWGCQSREVHVRADRRGIPWTEIEERYFALVDEIFTGGRGSTRDWPPARNFIRVDEIEDSNPDDDVDEQYFEPFPNDQLIIEADNPNLQSTRSSIFTHQAPAMGADRMKVYTYLIKTTLEIVGRGDFNDDGLDDVIVWFERNTVRDVPIYREGAYLLTREGPDAVLRLVDAPFTLLALHCPKSYERITGKPSPYKNLATDAFGAPLAGTAAAEEGHFPVWISPSVGAATPAEAAAMLTRRLPIDQDSPFRLEGEPYDDSKFREVWTCNELEQAFREGYVYTRDARVYDGYESDCRVLRFVAGGRPARRSYLRDFHLDRSAPTFLPAAFGVGTGCDAREIHVHANRRGIPWRDIEQSFDALANEIILGGGRTAEATSFVPIVVEIEEEDLIVAMLEVDQHIVTKENPWLASARFNTVADALLPMGPDRMRVYTYLVDRTLEIVARGDFNGDGIDDIVIWFDGVDTTGYVSPISNAFLLTRHAPDQILHLDHAPLSLLARFCQDDYERLTGERSPYP